jgi:hypothetical protein
MSQINGKEPHSLVFAATISGKKRQTINVPAEVKAEAAQLHKRLVKVTIEPLL